MEPTSTATASALAASISGLTLALLGVDYYALMWALVGALVAVTQAASMGRQRAFLFVVLSTMAGAALGGGVHDLMGGSGRPVLVLASLVGGFGAQALLGRAVAAVMRRIDRDVGGSSTAPEKETPPHV